MSMLAVDVSDVFSDPFFSFWPLQQKYMKLKSWMLFNFQKQMHTDEKQITTQTKWFPTH